MSALSDYWDMLRGRKGLTISHAGATLEPGGFVTELRDYRRPSYPSASTADLLDAQTRNELVFACLAVKASTAQDPRLIVERAIRRKGKTEFEEVPGHPMRALLMRPNAHMTEADLMRAALISWDISNPRRFYCEKEYTRGLLTALYPLNPACMRPLYSRSDAQRRIGYVWSDGTARREYADEELLIRSAPAWYDPPPLVAAMGSVDSDSAQTDYVRAFFAGGGIPPGFLKYGMPLNQEQRDEIRAKWLSNYGNAFGQQHSVGVLDVNVDYKEIGSKLDELSSEVLRSVAESRICMVFGVPPLIVYAYVGLLRATYSNLEEAWAGFWDATMSPTFKEWRSWYTWHLLSEFEEERDIRGERVRLRYDLSAVAALQEDVDAIQKRTRGNYLAGLITFNEARSGIGYAPVPGRDEEYYQGRAPVSVGAPSQTTITGGGKARGSKSVDSPSVQSIERRIEKAVREYLVGEYRQAAVAARAST